MLYGCVHDNKVALIDQYQEFKSIVDSWIYFTWPQRKQTA